jgi:hypothetical protein
MEGQQPQQTQTTQQATQQQVSFDDISLGHLTFNATYRVSKGSSSQLVLGLRNMSERLGEPQNDYQRTIYPLIRQFVECIVSQYETTFLSTTNPVERRVYGTSLNGFRNDGSLRQSVSGRVNRNLTYSYAQFGQLLTLLTGRFRYITSRDASRVRRFQDHPEEKTAFLKLQYDAQNFLTFLTTEVYDVWRARLNEARTTNNVNVQQRQDRQDRQDRQTTQRSQRFQQSEGHTTRPRHQQDYQPREQRQYQQNGQNGQREQNGQRRDNQTRGYQQNGQNGQYGQRRQSQVRDGEWTEQRPRRARSTTTHQQVTV